MHLGGSNHLLGVKKSGLRAAKGCRASATMIVGRAEALGGTCFGQSA
jgi:hypothetical protein